MGSIAKKVCSVEGCENIYLARSFCAKHYYRYMKFGDPSMVLQVKEFHGMTGSPERGAWKDMKARCLNSKSRSYKWYGARGIRICSRYMNSFTEFFTDLGKKPTSKHSLDRMNNDIHYSCGECGECVENGWSMNVRWATTVQQAVNRRSFKSKTGFRGIKKRHKWQAIVSIDGNPHSFGAYTTKEEAAYVRDQVALQLYGKSAILNFDLLGGQG